jgi:hypothetical protein
MKIYSKKSVSKVWFNLLFLISALVLLAVPGRATTWWVYASAPAGGTGTSASPFQTVDAGMAAAASGDTVMVKNGTYREASSLNMKTGVTLQAATGNTPVVTGNADLTPAGGTSWTTYTGTTALTGTETAYTASIPFVMRNLYNSSTRNPISRMPPSYDAWATITAYDSTNHIITLSAPLGVTFDSPRSSFVYIFEKTTLNSYLTYYIASMSAGGQTITIKIPSGDAEQGYIAPNDIMLVCNHPSLIRGSGDWSYQDYGTGTTTVVWDPGSSGNLNFAQASKAPYAIKAENLSNVTINGMEVTGGESAGIYCLKDSTVTIENCLVHDNGSGGPYGGPGVDVDTCTNPTVENCVISANWVGIGASSDTDLVIQQNEVAYNDSDGADIAGRLDSNGNPIPSEENTNPVINQNYFHNHVAMLHPDNIQFYNGVSNVTISNNYLNVSGQSIMSQAINGVTLTNNIFMGSGARNVILGHGTSTNWSFDNNTFAFGFYGATSADTPGTTDTYALLNTIFYHDPLSFSEESSTDYTLYWDDANQIANTSTPTYVNYYTNPTGSEKGIPAIHTYNSAYDAHSTGGNPAFMNAPVYEAQVLSGLLSSTTTSLVLDAQGGTYLTGYFSVGDVVEVDGDGVVRTITAVSNVSTAHTTIAITPALTNRPFRDLLVWDWPAGTTNVALDMRPSTGSPALTGSSTGGQRGSTINTLQYAADEFTGTGVRNTPVLSSGADHVFSIGGYSQYPFTGPNP